MKYTDKFQLIKNSIFNVGGWGLNTLTLLILTPFFVWKLTLEGYGIYILLTSLVGFYNLLDFGLGQGIIKFIAQYKKYN